MTLYKTDKNYCILVHSSLVVNQKLVAIKASEQ